MLPSTENQVASWFPFEYISTNYLPLAETAKLFCNVKFATQVVMVLVPDDLIATNSMLGKVPHQIQGKLKPLQHSGTF